MARRARRSSRVSAVASGSLKMFSICVSIVLNRCLSLLELDSSATAKSTNARNGARMTFSLNSRRSASLEASLVRNALPAMV